MKSCASDNRRVGALQIVLIKRRLAREQKHAQADGVIAEAVLRVGISLAIAADGEQRLDEENAPIAGRAFGDLFFRRHDDVFVIAAQKLLLGFLQSLAERTAVKENDAAKQPKRNRHQPNHQPRCFMQGHGDANSYADFAREANARLGVKILRSLNL